mmetsp:Transcript_65554/g.183294  ORF Transcript_65554/g.183294 Transcript_65554/m.183294 type:complete len:105 (+) Transcript_65554:1-315(+)
MNLYTLDYYSTLQRIFVQILGSGTYGVALLMLLLDCCSIQSRYSSCLVPKNLLPLSFSHVVLDILDSCSVVIQIVFTDAKLWITQELILSIRAFINAAQLWSVR